MGRWMASTLGRPNWAGYRAPRRCLPTRYVRFVQFAEILAHPVRSQVVQLLLEQTGLTTRQLREQLPDIPRATLYRHLTWLTEGKIIEVSEEPASEPPIDRIYRLAPSLTGRQEHAVGNPTADELQANFLIFTTGLLRDLSRYLESGRGGVNDDHVEFAAVSFWADDNEVDAVRRLLANTFQMLGDKKKAPGRTRRTLATVVMPQLPGTRQ